MDLRDNKIIILSPGGSLFLEPFATAFNRLGFECAIFDYRQGLVYTSKLIRGLTHKFPALKIIKRKKIARINQKLLRLVAEFKPRYLFAQKGENITPPTLESIKKMGVTTINFYNDFINQIEGIKKIAPHYDYFFSPDHCVLRELWDVAGLKNCFYLPCAVGMVSSDSPFENREEIFPITFIGTHNPEIYHNREPFLSKVKDLGLNIWGSDRWLKSSLAPNYQGLAWGPERFDIYRKSKIVIDINWNEWPCEATSMRPYEVGYSGALFLSDNTRADLFRVFKDGREFISFKNADELREKAMYYLNHPEERKKISQALHSNVISNHTYDKRVERIFSIAQKNYSC